MEAGQVPDGNGRALPAAGGGREPKEGLPCPRCESVNTKFCYYNNYNLSQPRHFCRACRRYWTRGGALRNVPVGGATRKATPTPAGRRKRASPAPVTASPPSALPPPPAPAPALHGSLLRPYGVGGLSFAAPALASLLAAADPDPDRRLLDLGGSFTSLIAPGADVGAHFSAGFLLAGIAPAAMPRAPASVAALPPPQQQQQQPTVSQALPEGMFWSMGWPDLSI